MSLKALPQCFSPQLKHREPETMDPTQRVLRLAAAQPFDQLTPTRGRAERAPRPKVAGGVEKSWPAQNEAPRLNGVGGVEKTKPAAEPEKRR